MMDRDAGTAMLGESPKMQRLRELIRKLGPRREPVLLQGPTGSGGRNWLPVQSTPKVGASVDWSRSTSARFLSLCSRTPCLGT